MPSPADILQVALPVPLSRRFDYLLPKAAQPTNCLPGMRVEVPFGRGSKIGVILGLCEDSAVPRHKLRAATTLLDRSPTLPADILTLLHWASRYYHHPIGEVVTTALPASLRQARDAGISSERFVELTAQGKQTESNSLGRARVQVAIIDQLRRAGSATPIADLHDCGATWREALRKLQAKALISLTSRPSPCAIRGVRGEGPALNEEQWQALSAISVDGGFCSYLLDGVTGSGKTEVYLRAMGQLIDAGKQVLVIVPEIGLTPQLVARFAARLPVGIATLHSGMADGERLTAWQQAADGRARVLIGTRSAVFTPMPELGGIFIDEEHDSSLKQQDGFRYHARDLALVRARNAGIPVVLGSATPSLESLHLAHQGRHQHLRLTQRGGNAKPPQIRLLDVRHRSLQEGLSDLLVAEIRRHLEQQGQVLLFLNRRGYAPTLLCDGCGQPADCKRCDAHMTVHAASRRLRCHHCGAERPVPPVCDHCGARELVMVGQGTERIEAALGGHFPDHQIVRIDRDSTRRKGSLEAQLEKARSGEAHILVGTQMLAKGHHFPDVTLVGMLDADRGLFGADFRAAEQMAQLILQVAGRAGRAERPGEVLIQTRNPNHPLLRTLIERGYPALAEAELAQRNAAGLPPFHHLALLRAESPQPDAPREFLDVIRGELEAQNWRKVWLLGPAPAPMERLAGRYRAQLLLQAEQRNDLQRLLYRLRPHLESHPGGRRVRWSLDVDPVDLL